MQDVMEMLEICVMYTYSVVIGICYEYTFLRSCVWRFELNSLSPPLNTIALLCCYIFRLSSNNNSPGMSDD